MNLALPMMTLLVVALSACSGERADDELVADAPADQPVDDVPPATAPNLAVPPPAAPAAVSGTISYVGFGPASFGANVEAVRSAWGKELKADAPSEPGGCYYLFPQPRPQGSYGIGFMIEGDKFSRIDVDSADIVAPGGGRIGVTADVIRKLYAGRIEEQNHKYVDGGKYLRIKDSAGGNGVLVFATDAAGTVTEWRIGVPPQVDYVEGCS
ncbi:MAG: hypothetical protein ACREPE_00965 [Lysobacter sp.]